MKEPKPIIEPIEIEKDNIKYSVKNFKILNNKSDDNEIKFYELVILEEKSKIHYLNY